MTDVVALGVLALVLVAAFVIYYRDEIRQLFPRLERFQAGRKGAEAVFGPSASPTSAGTEAEGSGDAVTNAESDDAAELASAEEEQESVDISSSTDVDELRKVVTRAVLDKDQARADQALDRIREVGSAKDLKLAKAWRDLARFHVDKDPEVLTGLKRQASETEIRAEVENLVGMALELTKRPGEAAEAYGRAARAAEKPNQRARALAARADQLIRSGQPAEALQEIETELRTATDQAARAVLWEAAAQVHGAKGDHLAQALALQQVLQMRPNDAELCFKIGYALSEAGKQGLSPVIVHYYQTALYFEPDHKWALNNLGVQLSNSDLPIEAVQAYERAGELENTLAMANLASLQLHAGFAEAADRTLQEARSKPDPHDNVPGGIAEVVRERARQRSAVGDLQSDGERLAEFLSAYTLASLDEGAPDLAADWRWEDDTGVAVSVTKAALELAWTEGRNKRKIHGQLPGRASEIAFSEMEYWTWSGEREERGWSRKAKGFLWIEKDLACMRLVRLNKKGLEFSVLRRK